MMRLESILTCPSCGHQSVETMPTDACQFFYDCKGCGVRLKPLAGDCCVFCSYGSVPCPPVQSNGRCCAPSDAQACGADHERGPPGIEARRPGLLDKADRRQRMDRQQHAAYA